MIVPTTLPWPRNLIPHEFSCQPKTRTFYPRNLIRVQYINWTILWRDISDNEFSEIRNSTTRELIFLLNFPNVHIVSIEVQIKKSCNCDGGFQHLTHSAALQFGLLQAYVVTFVYH